MEEITKDYNKGLTKVLLCEGVYGIEETGLLYIDPDYYKKLASIDISDFLKQKKNFSKSSDKVFDYIPYHKAIDLLRQNCPALYPDFVKNVDGGYVHYENLEGNKLVYIEVFLTNGIYKSIPLMVAITTGANRAMSPKEISSTDLRNNMARASVKAIAAVTGIGVQPFTQEDLEEFKQKQDLISTVNSLYSQIDELGMHIEIRDTSNMTPVQLQNHIKVLSLNVKESKKRKTYHQRIKELQKTIESKGVMLADYPALESMSIDELDKYGKSLSEQVKKLK
jgi:hypothetical protein